MRDYITYAGNALSVYGLFITNAGVYSTPARKYESIHVAGKSGNIILDNDEYDNVEHRYPVIIAEDFDRNFTALKSYLLTKKGYHRLVDTFNPDEFYLATFSRFEDVVQPDLRPTMGKFNMIFERKPQRFLTGGETPVEFTSNGEILNPTEYDALPLIRVYGSGTLTINGVSVEIDTESEYLDIDCEVQEVLQTGGNLDIILTNGEFPKLAAGVNTIQRTGLSKVVITPRWFRI